MGRMIAHPKLALDDDRHSCGGPDLTPEPVGFGSFGQQARQLSALLRRQFGWGTRRRVMAQGFRPSGFPFADPLTDRSFGDSQGFGDLSLRPPLFVQFPGAQPSAFAPIFRQRCVGVLHTSFHRLFSHKL